MTEVTYSKLVTDLQTIIWKLLKDNIPTSTVKHINDGRPVELDNNSDYPFIIVEDPEHSDSYDGRNLDYDTINNSEISIEINIYTVSSKQLREITDLVKSIIAKNRTTLNNYGFTKSLITNRPSNPNRLNDSSNRYEYNMSILLTLEWGGSVLL